MYLFFDTETSGLPGNHDAPASEYENWPRLVQIAWMLTDETGKELRNQSFIVRPDGFEIPASATRVHGITTQTARRLVIELEKVLTAFANDLSAGNILVGAINIAVYNLPVTNCSEMQQNASVYI